jgi:hypothetical protein
VGVTFQEGVLIIEASSYGMMRRGSSVKADMTASCEPTNGINAIALSLGKGVAMEGTMIRCLCERFKGFAVQVNFALQAGVQHYLLSCNCCCASDLSIFKTQPSSRSNKMLGSVKRTGLEPCRV